MPESLWRQIRQPRRQNRWKKRLKRRISCRCSVRKILRAGAACSREAARASARREAIRGSVRQVPHRGSDQQVPHKHSARQHQASARQEIHQANVHQVPYRHNARQERLLASDQQVLHQHSARQHQASARQEIHRASVRREASVRLIRAVSVSRIRAIREILVPCLHRRQDRMAAILLTREIPVTKIRDTTTTAVSGRPVDRAETSAETRTEKEAIITRAVTETMAARAEEM